MKNVAHAVKPLLGHCFGTLTCDSALINVDSKSTKNSR